MNSCEVEEIKCIIHSLAVLFVQAKIKDLYFKDHQKFEATNLDDGNVCVELYLSFFCVDLFVVQPALFANITEGGCSQVRSGVALGPGLHLGLQALCILQHT